MLPVLVYLAFYLLYFSPVLFSGKLLAQGNGLLQALPNYYAKKTLWTPLLFSGFPSFADPSGMLWYPPQILFNFLKISWNYFVLFAYVVASSLTYGLVHTLTKSKTAGFISGLIFGLSGFFLANLSSPWLLQSAAWLPGIIWGLESLKTKFSYKWFVFTGLFVALSILGGSPQIFASSLLLAVLYFLITGWRAPLGKLKYYSLCFLAILLGIGATALQLIPSYELLRLKLGEATTFQYFIGIASNPKMLVGLFFPYIFGGANTSFYPGQTIVFNGSKFSNYLGITPLILALLGIFSNKKPRRIFFWSCLALLGLFLPLSNITILAISLLAGYGVLALQQLELKKIRDPLRASLAIVTLAFTVALFSILIFKNSWTSLLQNIAIPWKNPAIYLPFLILLANCLFFFTFKPINKKFKFISLTFLVLLDLVSFGQFQPWNSAAPSQNILIPSAAIIGLEKTLALGNQRILPVTSTLLPAAEIMPNLSILNSLASASGYNPLLLARYGQLLNMQPTGEIISSPFAPNTLAYDLLAVRYLLIDKKNYKNNEWPNTNPNIEMNGSKNQIEIAIPFKTATQLNLVTNLENSASITDGAEVVTIEITTTAGKTLSFPLIAGKDTAESAWDRADVRPTIKHARAKIFESLEELDATGKFYQRHNYSTTIALGGSYQLQSIKFQWVNTQEAKGGIVLYKIGLSDEKSGLAYPLELTNLLVVNGNFKLLKNIGTTSVYENLKALPRAWLVPNILCLSPDKILNVIHTATLPTGETFDPRKLALVETPVQFSATQKPFAGNVANIKIAATKVTLTATSNAAALLVLSDVYYPGWKAYVDGKTVPIYPTDYVLRGIVVPAGQHSISFEFKPLSLYVGVGISLLSLFLLLVIYL